MRLLVVGVLAFLVATVGGRLDLGAAVANVRDSVARAPVVRTVTGNTSTDDATVAAIKDAITKANHAQADALAKGDPTLMRATATDAYYQELVQINRDLANAGVTAIELTNLEWSDVTVDGTTAHAVAVETWRSTYSDGSTDERSDRNEYTLVQQNGVWRIQSDVQPDSLVVPAGGTSPGTGPSSAATNVSRSSNWSGYAASGGSFTSVSATWTVPNVAPTGTGADATWVGIGGLTSNDLIQAGTQAVVSGGTVEYSAWTEMLPAASRTVSLSVNAGDSVTVSITQKSATEWTIAMKNNTTGGTYSTTVQYSSSNSSAEWVQEAPSAGRGLLPLDQFGTVTFTSASAVRDGRQMSLSELGARAITMINAQGEALAQPSTLSNDGSSFSITRTDAQPTIRGTNPNRRRGGP
jgi:hypothetical protein